MIGLSVVLRLYRCSPYRPYLLACGPFCRVFCRTMFAPPACSHRDHACQWTLHPRSRLWASDASDGPRKSHAGAVCIARPPALGRVADERALVQRAHLEAREENRALLLRGDVAVAQEAR
jgi:hypothetical protein